MQGGVFFDEEFDGTIYFDVTAEIEELLAIFRFPGSSEIPEMVKNRGYYNNFGHFSQKKVLQRSHYIYSHEK